MPFWACRRFSASSHTTELRAVDHLGGDLVSAMGGQTMHEYGVWFRICHKAPIDPVGGEQVMAGFPVLLVHRDPGVGDDAVGAGDRGLRIAGDADLAALRLAQAIRSGGGFSPSGQASRSSKPNRTAA